MKIKFDLDDDLLLNKTIEINNVTIVVSVVRIVVSEEIDVNKTSEPSGIMINVGASVKIIIYVKRIICGILLHVVVKMVNT